MKEIIKITPDEIANKLRGRCPSDFKGTCSMCEDAADLIESLTAQIKQKDGEIAELKEKNADLQDTINYCLHDWEDTDWDDDWDDEHDDDWLDGNECRPFDKEPDSELSGYRCCENCGNEQCSKCAYAFNWDDCVDSNFQKHWIPKLTEKDGEQK